VPDDLGAAGDGAGVDDVVDAAAAAWTGRRVAQSLARSLPDPPERFSDGLDCAIWI
jgi:predicted RNase H-like nuclease